MIDTDVQIPLTTHEFEFRVLFNHSKPAFASIEYCRKCSRARIWYEEGGLWFSAQKPAKPGLVVKADEMRDCSFGLTNVCCLDSDAGLVPK